MIETINNTKVEYNYTPEECSQYDQFGDPGHYAPAQIEILSPENLSNKQREEIEIEIIKLHQCL